MADIDVSVGNRTLIDIEIYDLWIKGFTEPEACTIQQKKGLLQKFGITSEMLLAEIENNYRLFNVFEKFLKTPKKLTEQLIFQIEPETTNILIEKYYSLNSIVIREILGKKLSTKNRNQLDDVAERNRIPLKSCRRQFDNLKRIFKVVEDLMGSLVENISNNFLISEKLARQYAAIVFITNNRLDTSKKRLLHITFDDFAYCANELITNWSYSSLDCKSHEDMDVDLDQEFLLELRELKGLNNYLDDHKMRLLNDLRNSISANALKDFEQNFKTFAKVFINIAYNLNHSKELKDFFNDLIEKIVDPLKNCDWTIDDVNIFLTNYSNSCTELEFFRQNPNLVRTWERYIYTVNQCIIRLFMASN